MFEVVVSRVGCHEARHPWTHTRCDLPTLCWVLYQKTTYPKLLFPAPASPRPTWKKREEPNRCGLVTASRAWGSDGDLETTRMGGEGLVCMCYVTAITPCLIPGFCPRSCRQWVPLHVAWG